MGAWGFKPWENDSAADWFAEMHEHTGLREIVMATIRRGVKQEGIGGIRAAVHVLTLLGKTYTWPVLAEHADLRLAIQAMGEVRARLSEDMARVKSKGQAEAKGRNKDWHRRQVKDIRKTLKLVDAETATPQKRVHRIERIDRKRLQRLRQSQQTNVSVGWHRTPK